MSIGENLKTVRERIANAAKNCGRSPDSIKLIAVSKTKPVSDILEAVKAGQLAFGENYAQELRDKSKELSGILPITNHESLITEVKWHFIGHLQKNKIKYVLPVANWIHTIDSVDILKAIHQRVNAQTRKPVNCFIEVNISNESSKSGISPENVFELISAFTQTLKHLNTQTLLLRGLMCMPPFSDNPETSRPYFKKLKNLLDEINSRNIYPEKLIDLSMGMTQDFEVAIEEGSTMVRIGSAIFGERS